MKYLITIILFSFVIQSPLFAADADISSNVLSNISSNNSDGQLSQRTDQIKAQVIELNRDLFLLEEDLLHPASTRLALYVSIDNGSFFKLESVKLKLDGKPITSFLYTSKDVDALKRGAIHPVYQGNIATGEHELVAFFTGIGSHGRTYKRAVSLKFDKEDAEKAFEVQIKDDSASLQPIFKIKSWK